MDIDRLRYFCAVARTASLTEAAKVLRISQPALSKAMKILEDEVGGKLLVQSGRGIIVSDFGKEFAQRAQTLLEQLEGLKYPEKKSSSGPSKITLASFEVFSSYFFGQLVTKFFTKSSVDIYEMIPGEMEEQIALGRVDLGITYLPIPHPDLDIIKVASVEMGVFALKQNFSKCEFKDIPFVVPITPIAGAPTKVEGLDGWPDDRIPRKVQFRVGLMESALELCRRGLCAAYLPKFVVDLHNKNVKSELALHPLNVQGPAAARIAQKQGVHIVKRKSSLEDSTTRLVAKALRELS